MTGMPVKDFTVNRYDLIQQRNKSPWTKTTKTTASQTWGWGFFWRCSISTGSQDLRNYNPVKKNKHAVGKHRIPSSCTKGGKGTFFEIWHFKWKTLNTSKHYNPEIVARQKWEGIIIQTYHQTPIPPSIHTNKGELICSEQTRNTVIIRNL